MTGIRKKLMETNKDRGSAKVTFPTCAKNHLDNFECLTLFIFLLPSNISAANFRWDPAHAFRKKNAFVEVGT